MHSWPYNYHAHTPFGDGHSDSTEYAAEALRRGMRAIGFSEHAPLGPDVPWTMAAASVEGYRSEIHSLRDEYAGRLEVLCGLECDWWPARSACLDANQSFPWDYAIGSVHFVTTSAGTWQVDESPPDFEEGVNDLFAGDIRSACDAFFEMERQAATSGRFDVLGHCDIVKKYNKDHRYFDPTGGWYREMALSVVDAAAASGIIVEVNTAGLDKPVGEYYPAPWMVERCVERNVRLTLSSDAHRATDIQRHFDSVLPELHRLGVRELWRLSGGVWGAVGL